MDDDIMVIPHEDLMQSDRKSNIPLKKIGINRILHSTGLEEDFALNIQPDLLLRHQAKDPTFSVFDQQADWVKDARMKNKTLEQLRFEADASVEELTEDEIPEEHPNIDAARMDRLYEEIHLDSRQETTFFGLITIGEEKPTIA